MTICPSWFGKQPVSLPLLSWNPVTATGAMAIVVTETSLSFTL